MFKWIFQEKCWKCQEISRKVHKKPPLSAALLVPETDLPCLFIHMLNDGQRLHMIPFLTQKLSAHLLSFLGSLTVYLLLLHKCNSILSLILAGFPAFFFVKFLKYFCSYF